MTNLLTHPFVVNYYLHPQQLIFLSMKKNLFLLWTEEFDLEVLEVLEPPFIEEVEEETISAAKLRYLTAK